MVLGLMITIAKGTLVPLLAMKIDIGMIVPPVNKKPVRILIGKREVLRVVAKKELFIVTPPNW